MEASSIFMKVAGVTGESTNDAFRQWSDIISVDIGMLNPRRPGSSGTERAQPAPRDVSCTGIVDTATVGLMQKLVNGANIPKVEFAFVKMGGTQVEYARLTIEDVYVTSVQVGTARASQLPEVSYSFSFTRMKYEYKAQTEKGAAGGATVMTWDINQNKP